MDGGQGVHGQIGDRRHYVGISERLRNPVLQHHATKALSKVKGCAENAAVFTGEYRPRYGHETRLKRRHEPILADHVVSRRKDISGGGSSKDPLGSIDVEERSDVGASALGETVERQAVGRVPELLGQIRTESL
jgi:hypothetical protein